MKSDCCWDCLFGAGRFWEYPIMNCMNVETECLIVSTKSACEYHKPYTPVEEKSQVDEEVMK